jgi:hypothetical protein
MTMCCTHSSPLEVILETERSPAHACWWIKGDGNTDIMVYIPNLAWDNHLIVGFTYSAIIVIGLNFLFSLGIIPMVLD